MKNTADLRSFLIERMENLASGKESVSHSHAVAALAKQVNATLSLELAASRVTAASQGISPLQIK